MSLSRRSIRGASIIVAISATLSAAGAQCLEWDPRFGAPLELQGAVRAIQTYDDGTGPSLYVGGSFTQSSTTALSHIARWTGSEWVSVGSGVSNDVNALAVFDDGSGPALYAAGAFGSAGGQPALAVARWNGTTWSSVGNPFFFTSTPAYALAVCDDGSGPALFIGGNMSFPGGSRVAKWNGVVWSPLGLGVDGPVKALVAFDDGSGSALYVGGSFNGAGGMQAQRIARWRSSGWSSIGNVLGPTGTSVNALSVFDDGSGSALYAGGRFSSVGGQSATNIAGWNGTSWAAAGSLNSDVHCLAVADDGSGSALFAGGNFALFPSSFRVAKWNGASWSGLTTGASSTVYALGSAPNAGGTTVVVGGDFETCGSVYSPNIATWHAGAWGAITGGGQGMTGDVSALCVFDYGTGASLYAGGDFPSVGSVASAGIGRWNGSSWSPVGIGVESFAAVTALCGANVGGSPELFACGNFTIIGGINALRIARWNGSAWSALGTGLNNVAYTLATFDDGSGPAVYVGGSFTLAGGVATSYIARWNGTTWSAVGGGVNGRVDCLATLDDGSGLALYASGVFGLAGGTPCNRIARWDGTAWSALGTGLNNSAFDMVVFDDGTGPALFAGGTFAMAGSPLAKWNGSTWVPGPPINGWLFALTVFDDGSGPALYAGGNATRWGGTSANNIAKLNGATWTYLSTGTNSVVSTLAVFDDGISGGPDLYAGGGFSEAGGLSSTGIAEWHGCAGPATSFCFGDASIVPCPCGNSGFPQHGCANSAGVSGALLSASGTTSPDTLILTASGELPTSLSIFLQGDVELPSPAVFGDGLRCVGGQLRRLFAHNASAGSVSAPAPGDLSITARSAQLGDTIPPGGARSYQVYYRDPLLNFCQATSGSTFNITSGVRVVW